MDKKIILSLLVVALIGIVAATYQINNGVDILNPLSNVEIEDTPVTETLEAPAEAATGLNSITGDDANKKSEQSKASDTQVENSEPVNTTSTPANTSGSNANSSSNNANTNATGNSSAGNTSQATDSASTTGGSNVNIGTAGNTSGITEGQSGSGSSSGSNQASSPQSTINVQPSTGGNTPSTGQSDNQGSSDNNGEISIGAARSIVEQFILEKWTGNKVTLSYGTTVINDYGDKCYIYNMINDNGQTEGQASYNLRNQTIEIMDNSGAEYLSEVAM